MDTLTRLVPFRNRFIGAGLDLAEVVYPPSMFADVSAPGGADGLQRVTHAWEEAGSGYVWQALDVLHVERIDHVVWVTGDPALLERLRTDGVPFTVGPSSNVALWVVDTMTDHPFLELLRAGVPVTINSDDPTYFSGYVDDNYSAVCDTFDLTDSDLAQLAPTSPSESFTSESDRQRWLVSLSVSPEKFRPGHPVGGHGSDWGREV